MTPRNTQLGASASARGTSRTARGAAAPSARSRSRAASDTSSDAASASSRTRQSSSARAWWVLPLIGVALLVVFVWTYYPVARVQYRETREKSRLEAEKRMLEQRNERLRTQVARLKTPEGVEDYARSQLGMAKQGEHVVVVVDGESKPSTVTAGVPRIDSDEVAPVSDGPWTAFLDTIFGLR